MKLLKHFEQGLASLEKFAICLILGVMILFSFGQVILRNFFDGGLLWADILLRHGVLWVGFLGASLAVREGRHISIDFLPHFLSRSWTGGIRLFVHLVTAGVSGVLAWAAWEFVLLEREFGSSLVFDVPTWFFQTVLPYSFVVITARFLLFSRSPGSSNEPL
jgi:TRAP-type C4-dicarboxylate transport system permease small subunit